MKVSLRKSNAKTEASLGGRPGKKKRPGFPFWLYAPGQRISPLISYHPSSKLLIIPWAKKNFRTQTAVRVFPEEGDPP
jgi:hypothetical protein